MVGTVHDELKSTDSFIGDSAHVGRASKTFLIAVYVPIAARLKESEDSKLRYRCTR